MLVRSTLVLALASFCLGCEGATVVTPTPTAAVPPTSVVGQGTINGVIWIVTVREKGDGNCFDTAFPPAEPHSGSCSSRPALEGPFLGSFGSAGGSGAPTVVSGTTSLAVSAVRVEMREGFTEVPVVKVDALGETTRAFAAAFPEGWNLVAVVALDSQGGILQRSGTGLTP
jgi:hypothetical protein